VFIPEAGHSMMKDNPDAFYGEVIKFIGTLRARTEVTQEE